MASTERKFFVCGNQLVDSDHATTTIVNLRGDIPIPILGSGVPIRLYQQIFYANSLVNLTT